MARVWVPALLRELTGGAELLEAPGRTVREVLDRLDERHPGLKDRLAPSGRLEPWIMVSVDGAVAGLGLAEPVQESSEILFVPAMGGGAELRAVLSRPRRRRPRRRPPAGPSS
jgi:molybdopterin synthase sulfur carrier subunit